MDGDMTNDLCVTFISDGDVVDRWYVSDGEAALKVALIVLSLHGALYAGDCLQVEKRRRPTLIEAGLG